MTTLDLKSYTNAEIEDLREQIQQEIRVREDTAYNERVSKWMSPAYAPLRQYHQQRGGFSRRGWYPYTDYMEEVENWARHLGVADTAEDWVPRMVAKLEVDYRDFDDFVDPPE